MAPRRARDLLRWPPRWPAGWAVPGKRFFVLVAAGVTISVAVITALQTDASIRANRANRQSQALALDVAEALVRTNVRATYDLDVARESAERGVRSAALTLAALGESDPVTAAELSRQAQVAQATSDALRAASTLYADPRYAPKEDGKLPDGTKYLADSTAEVAGLSAKQQSANEDRQHWGNISDGYVLALTVLAVSLFILGLAQALPVEARLRVGMVGVGVAAMGWVWTLMQIASAV